jgi:hypothetical protein
LLNALSAATLEHSANAMTGCVGAGEDGFSKRFSGNRSGLDADTADDPTLTAHDFVPLTANGKAGQE